MSTATQSLRPLVDRMRRVWRVSPLPGFLHWWGSELRACLPSRWRGWFGVGADWHLLQHAGTQWTLRRAGHDDILARCEDTPTSMPGSESVHSGAQAVLDAALSHADREDLRLALLLPPSAVLRRTLVLPVAARENLHQVLAFEMDRQTPFNVAQVHYAARELATPAGAGRFHVELIAVTRSTLDPLLVRLQDMGIAVDAVDLAAGADRLGVNLLPPALAPRRVRPRRRLNLVLAGIGVLLLALLLGRWLHNRQAALAQMQSQVESMRGAAQQVAALRQQLLDNAGAAGFLVQRKKDTVSMLSLLQDVTQRLPDDAWLERFSIDNAGQVGMQGQSRQAAKLLDALKDSPLISDASFQGSIQPDPSTGKERFYLTARLRQLPKDAGASATAAPPVAGAP
jgi:general secretion pathway protein L